MTRCGVLGHPLLRGCGVRHGFGVRGSPPPQRLLRPRQVHGKAVAEACGDEELVPVEADAVVSTRPGLAVGVVTADCVPILLASSDGGVVAAIHAGWRGLAAGVVEAGLEALRIRSPAGYPARAVIGPHIGRCCYEVDDAVLCRMSDRFASELDSALSATRPGHARLDLGLLVRSELMRLGVEPAAVGQLSDACTACHPERFFSYRRDGTRAGRLLHYIAARIPGEEEGDSGVRPVHA